MGPPLAVWLVSSVPHDTFQAILIFLRFTVRFVKFFHVEKHCLCMMLPACTVIFIATALSFILESLGRVSAAAGVAKDAVLCTLGFWKPTHFLVAVAGQALLWLARHPLLLHAYDSMHRQRN